jgi:hypothetical protein
MFHHPKKIPDLTPRKGSMAVKKIQIFKIDPVDGKLKNILAAENF